jgi:RNA binding exosome subunit
VGELADVRLLPVSRQDEVDLQNISLSVGLQYTTDWQHILHALEAFVPDLGECT